jgi:hypothetical protein
MLCCRGQTRRQDSERDFHVRLRCDCATPAKGRADGKHSLPHTPEAIQITGPWGDFVRYRRNAKKLESGFEVVTS